MLKSITHRGWAALVVMMLLTTLVVSSTPPQAFSAPMADHVPNWAPYTAYAAGTLVTYNGAHYRAVQAHTSLPGWEPPNVPALWQVVQDTSPTPTRTNTAGPTRTPTRTPTGPTPTRTRTPVGPTPTRTRTPTQMVATPTPTATSGGTPAWATGVSYAVGTVVSYSGRLYRCLLAHTSQPGWEPPNAPALWQPLPTPTPSPTFGPSPTPFPTPRPGTVIVGYFVQWGIYARQFFAKNVEANGSADKLNFINYAFNNVVNNKCEVGVTATGRGDAYADYQMAFSAVQSVDGVADDPWNQPLRGNWNQLKKLKARHPNIKVLISLGGWTWSDGLYAAARPENRAAFVASCIDAYIKGNLPFDAGTASGGPGAALGVFDGIDVDWEYPGMCGNNPQCGASPADTANFNGLMAEFRRQLDAESARTGKRYYLTIAGPAGKDKLDLIQPGSFHQYLDFINVMTYDFHGGWEATGPTNFMANLYAHPNDPSTGVVKNYYGDFAISYYRNAGVPANKLLIGVPFYARGWTGVPNTNNGLFQPASGPAAGDFQEEPGVRAYKTVKALNYPVFRDPANTQAMWAYNGSDFWSYDDPTSLAVKTAYIKSKGLYGVMFWELSGDTTTGELITALYNGLR